MLNVEETIVASRCSKDAIEVISVGVGNENLLEFVATYIVDDATHSASVEFVENIVKQKYGSASFAFGLEVNELGKFHRDKVCFLLPLATFTTNVVAVHRQLKIVLVGAVERVSYDAFSLSPTLQNWA